MSGLTVRRHVGAALCLSRVPDFETIACPSQVWILFTDRWCQCDAVLCRLTLHTHTHGHITLDISPVPKQLGLSNTWCSETTGKLKNKTYWWTNQTVNVTPNGHRQTDNNSFLFFFFLMFGVEVVFVSGFWSFSCCVWRLWVMVFSVKNFSGIWSKYWANDNVDTTVRNKIPHLHNRLPQWWSLTCLQLMTSRSDLAHMY